MLIVPFDTVIMFTSTLLIASGNQLQIFLMAQFNKHTIHQVICDVTLLWPEMNSVNTTRPYRLYSIVKGVFVFSNKDIKLSWIEFISLKLIKLPVALSYSMLLSLEKCVSNGLSTTQHRGILYLIFISKNSSIILPFSCFTQIILRLNIICHVIILFQDQKVEKKRFDVNGKLQNKKTNRKDINLKNLLPLRTLFYYIEKECLPSYWQIYSEYFILFLCIRGGQLQW